MGVHCYMSPCSAAYPRARPRSTTVRRHPHIGAGTTTRGPRRTNESRHSPAHIAFIAFGAAALERVFTRFIAFIAFGAAALARMFTRFIAFIAFGAAALATMLTRFIAFIAFGAAALARTVTRFIAFIAFIAFAMTSRETGE